MASWKPEDIERIMQELRPLLRQEPTPEEDERECRLGIEFALKEIAGLSRPYPGQVRKRLSKFSSDVARMILSASDLPKSAREKLGLSNEQLAKIKRWGQVSGQWSSKIKVKRTSPTVAKGEKMQTAASWAMILLYGFTDKRPTSTISVHGHGGAFLRITEDLYEIATGRQGDAEKACLRILRQKKSWPDFLGELERPGWEEPVDELLPPPPPSRKSL
jgi:hypothetical protein